MGFESAAFHAMGTDIELLGAPRLLKPLAEQVRRLFGRVESRLSRFRAGSELSQLNRSDGRPFRASTLLRGVLRDALAAARSSGGLFDPTVLEAVEAGELYIFTHPDMAPLFADRARRIEEAFARAAGEVLKRRLRVGPDQEDIVDHALRDAQGALKDLHGVLRDSREGLAGAFAGEAVDEAAIAAAFSRQDEALKRARQDLASALKQVHAVLDEGQRTRLAELLGKSEGWFQG